MTRKLLAVLAVLALPTAALAEAPATTKDAVKTEARVETVKAGATTHKAATKGKAKVKKASPRRVQQSRPHVIKTSARH